MKTEDIDKRIGMPDVDAEWARFEQEVIGKETKASKRSLYSWIGSFAIAASVVIVAGLFFLNHDSRETEQIMREKNKISLMPRWRPAIWGGKPTKTRYHLPIIFDAIKAEQQKFLAKNLSSESVDQALQEQIAGLDIVPNSSYLGNGTTMRLRGTGSRPNDKDRIDSTLILVNGEPLPDSLKWQVLGESPDDVDTYLPRYFSQQGLLIDSVYVHKDSYYTEKYGGRAKYGMIEIKVVPDTYCDAYVRKHPELMKKYTRVEGYVMNNEDKPLTEAWVHVKRERALLKEHPELDYFVGAATDSTGHYVIWLPKDIDITLCAEQTGYKSFEFSPSDKNLVMQLETGASMRLRGNPVPTPELQGVIAGLPDAPPNDSILYIVNGVPQPKENNKWLSKRSFLDYFHGQHLLVDSVKRNMNEEAKQRYIERFGMAAKHGVVEYFCVEDTLCDYYMNQHEELKASRYRISGIVLDENNKPLPHTIIAVVKDGNKIWGSEAADSTGHFAFWAPRTGVKIHFSYVGFYKVVELKPTDKPLTIRMKPTKDLKKLKKLSFE